MDELRERLSFLTDWVPDDVRQWAPDEIWWLAYLAAALAALLIVGTFLRAVFTLLFHRKPPVTSEWEPDLREELSTLPMPNTPAVASVYHLPARLRLVVVASAGKGVVLDPSGIVELLDKAVPGLGALARHDRPRVVLWPAPISESGFAGSFHRATPTGQGAEELSRWVFLAGRARGGGEAIFIGLALWADEPTTLGRKNLKPMEWLEVLRLESRR